MSAKNNFLILTFILLFLICLVLISCVYLEPSSSNQANNQDTVIILNNTNESNIVIVLDTSKTIILDENTSDLQPEQEKGQILEEPQEQPQEQTQEQANPRVSEVDFYFLLKGKAYFRATLKEQESKTYNTSGYLVTISPVFISSDRAKFQINNYTTKALAEEEWGSTQEFEIMVKDIYCRS